MKKYVSILKTSKLFVGLENEEIIAMLACLGAKLSTYKKGEYVLRQGEYLSNVFILVEGSLLIQNDDYWGNRSILRQISQGEMFGESYIAPESDALLNDVAAITDSTVIFFDLKKIIGTCSSACPFHTKAVQNLFFAISEKNRKLVQKMGHISKRSTREKLLSFLSDEAKKRNSSDFTIPFNRQQLADFLSVDRSAMSKELCKLRDEGLLEFDKNSFRLL